MSAAVWLSIALLGLITFCYRFSFISSAGRKIADRIPREFLELLAPATFTAIITSHLLAHRNDPGGAQWLYLTAAVSLVVAWITRSMLATLVFGLGLLYGLQHWAG